MQKPEVAPQAQEEPSAHVSPEELEPSFESSGDVDEPSASAEHEFEPASDVDEPIGSAEHEPLPETPPEPEPARHHPAPARPRDFQPAPKASIQRSIQQVNDIMDTLRESLEDMEEVLETLETFERQGNADEREIESLRRALRHLQRPREGGGHHRGHG